MLSKRSRQVAKRLSQPAVTVNVSPASIGSGIVCHSSIDTPSSSAMGLHLDREAVIGARVNVSLPAVNQPSSKSSSPDARKIEAPAASSPRRCRAAPDRSDRPCSGHRRDRPNRSRCRAARLSSASRCASERSSTVNAAPSRRTSPSTPLPSRTLQRRLAPVDQMDFDGRGVVAAGGEIGLVQRIVRQRAGELHALHRKAELRARLGAGEAGAGTAGDVAQARRPRRGR